MKNFNAIRYMYPDAVFSMVDDDPNQITWVGQTYPIPSAEELEAATQAMADAAAQAAANKEATKANALAKLSALGLTAEEVLALFN